MTYKSFQTFYGSNNIETCGIGRVVSVLGFDSEDLTLSPKYEFLFVLGIFAFLLLLDIPAYLSLSFGLFQAKIRTFTPN